MNIFILPEAPATTLESGMGAIWPCRTRSSTSFKEVPETGEFVVRIAYNTPPKE